MRKTRSLLLTGTVLPALILSGPSPARPFEEGGANWIEARVQFAQADEPRGGGRGGPGGPGGGPGGPGGGPGGAERGGPPRGGAERGGPPERAAPPAARERPEPREAPAARERPEPRQAPSARPDRDDKPEPRQAPKAQPKPDRDDDRPAAREKQEPRQAPAKPAAKPDRDDDRPSAREKPSAKPDRDDDKPAAREKPAARPDRDDDRPGREKPAAKPDRDDDKPSAREKPDPRQAPGARDRKDDRQKDDRDDDKPTTRERPGERPGDRTPSGQQRQDRDKQDRDRPDRQERDKSDRDDRDDRPGRGNADRPADRPNAPASPNAAQPGAPNQPVAPNQRPGVPGRPVQAPNATPPGQPNAQQPNAQQQPGARPDDQRRDRFNTPGRAGYIPGGFRDDDDEFRDYGRVRRDRREYDVDGRSYYREPGRIIVRDRDNYYIRHDENERFRYIGREGYGGYGGYRTERRGVETYSYIDRPGGEQIITVVDDDGRLVRRSRRYRDGREVFLINNSYGPGGGGPRPIYEDVVDLPPPRIDIPRERYVVDYGRAEPRAVYGALTAPPVQPIERRYTLDQVRYSPQLRARMPSVDINTITFDSGAFTVAPDQARQLQTIADGINQAIQANPQEVFLIEGYTDAVGEPVDNLSLSDRRAQSVATILTQDFKVPPENLTTQGYGEQNLRVQTEEANRENRRVTVRRITPLLQQQADQGEAPPPK